MDSASLEKLGLRPFELLLDQNRIAARIGEIGRQITTDYAHETPIIVGILKGCAIFMADLIRNIKLPLEIEFISAASYRKADKREGELILAGAVPIPLENRHVILVEGVVDSGRTVAAMLKQVKKQNPASVEVATLIDKPVCHRHKVDIKYVGFSLGNEFVIGFGLDNTQKYRNLPFIGRLIEQN